MINTKLDKYDEVADSFPLIRTDEWDDPFFGPDKRKRDIKAWRTIIASRLRSAFPPPAEDAGECADAVYGILTGEDEGMSNPTTRHEVAAEIESFAQSRVEPFRKAVVTFCKAQSWASKEWKEQPHIKALFDLALLSDSSAKEDTK